jgi:hypothetical protein
MWHLFNRIRGHNYTFPKEEFELIPQYTPHFCGEISGSPGAFQYRQNRYNALGLQEAL